VATKRTVAAAHIPSSEAGTPASAPNVLNIETPSRVA